MGYLDKLDTLLGGLRAGAYDPQDALSGLMELQQNRRDRRKEARQASQDALSNLSTVAYTAASEGDPLSSLLMNPEFSAATSSLGLNPHTARQAVKQMGYYGPGGMSALNPQLDPEDLGQIEQEVFAAIKPDPTTLEPPSAQKVRDSIINKLGLTPQDYALLPQIDEAISAAYTRAVKGF